MTLKTLLSWVFKRVSTHMPLARHDFKRLTEINKLLVSTHMPLARHDKKLNSDKGDAIVSTHMPLARHDRIYGRQLAPCPSFYSHASCEA